MGAAVGAAVDAAVGATDMPLTYAVEVPLMQEASQLDRLKEALNLYVKAKFVDNTPLLRLEGTLAKLRVSPRFVRALIARKPGTDGAGFAVVASSTKEFRPLHALHGFFV